MSITIKEISAEDKEEFNRFFKKAVQNFFPEYNTNTRNWFADKPYSETMFDLRIKFGAFDNEKLIGLAIGADYDGGVALIYWLAVDEAYRNQGIGTNLLKHFEDFLKENGYHNVHLNADERNLDFYKKLGYKVIGREEKGFYGANDFILSKILQEPKEENFFKMKIDQ